MSSCEFNCNLRRYAEGIYESIRELKIDGNNYTVENVVRVLLEEFAVPQPGHPVPALGRFGEAVVGRCRLNDFLAAHLKKMLNPLSIKLLCILTTLRRYQTGTLVKYQVSNAVKNKRSLTYVLRVTGWACWDEDMGVKCLYEVQYGDGEFD
jgi:hypothetical protein